MYADFFAHPDLFVRYEPFWTFLCFNKIVFFKFNKKKQQQRESSNCASYFHQHRGAAGASGANGSGGQMVLVRLPRREERLSRQKALQSNPGRGFLLSLGSAQWGGRCFTTHGEDMFICGQRLIDQCKQGQTSLSLCEWFMTRRKQEEQMLFLFVSFFFFFNLSHENLNGPLKHNRMIVCFFFF